MADDVVDPEEWREEKTPTERTLPLAEAAFFIAEIYWLAYLLRESEAEVARLRRLLWQNGISAEEGKSK